MDEELFEAIKSEILGTMSRYANNVRVLKLRVVPLDDYGLEGLQALKVVLSLQLKESETLYLKLELK